MLPDRRRLYTWRRAVELDRHDRERAERHDRDRRRGVPDPGRRATRLTRRASASRTSTNSASSWTQPTRARRSRRSSGRSNPTRSRSTPPSSPRTGSTAPVSKRCARTESSTTRPGTRPAAIKHGLAAAGHSLGIVKIHDTIRGRRFLFADEIILATMAHACGGETQMYDTVTAASNAIGDFLHFADTAIARYVLDQKPDLRMCEPIDPNDWAKGWKCA
jgi:hypothetical protein